MCLVLQVLSAVIASCEVSFSKVGKKGEREKDKSMSKAKQFEKKKNNHFDSISKTHCPEEKEEEYSHTQRRSERA